MSVHTWEPLCATPAPPAPALLRRSGASVLLWLERLPTASARMKHSAAASTGRTSTEPSRRRRRSGTTLGRVWLLRLVREGVRRAAAGGESAGSTMKTSTHYPVDPAPPNPRHPPRVAGVFSSSRPPSPDAVSARPYGRRGRLSFSQRDRRRRAAPAESRSRCHTVSVLLPQLSPQRLRR